MSFILCIETATKICSVAISHKNRLLVLKETDFQNSHSSILTPFIKEALVEAGISAKDLEAVAVSKGPGSFTGLRIGVSVAKGLCYALDIPLIAISTLFSMALGMKIKYMESVSPAHPRILFCPLIDARRMEVYNALYDIDLKEIREIKAEIIHRDSYQEILEAHPVLFFGDGASKCKSILSLHSNALFDEQMNPSAAWMVDTAWEKFTKKSFEEVAYFEPYYLKDFIAVIPRVKGLA